MLTVSRKHVCADVNSTRPVVDTDRPLLFCQKQVTEIWRRQPGTEKYFIQLKLTLSDLCGYSPCWKYDKSTQSKVKINVGFICQLTFEITRMDKHIIKLLLNVLCKLMAKVKLFYGNKAALLNRCSANLFKYCFHKNLCIKTKSF